MSACLGSLNEYQKGTKTKNPKESSQNSKSNHSGRLPFSKLSEREITWERNDAGGSREEDGGRGSREDVKRCAYGPKHVESCQQIHTADHQRRPLVRAPPPSSSAPPRLRRPSPAPRHPLTADSAAPSSPFFHLISSGECTGPLLSPPPHSPPTNSPAALLSSPPPAAPPPHPTPWSPYFGRSLRI